MSLSRRAWTHYEPIHAIVYFVPEARVQYDAAGLRGGWMGYFASRSAPMGAVGADVVTAVFHNFRPEMVRRAIPDAWSYSTPDRVLAARLAVADGALRRLWGDEVEGEAVAEAAELAREATTHLRIDGRPLFAGHAALAPPPLPHLALWHWCTLLREHRFDGHVAILTGYGVDGLAALVLQVAAGKGVDAVTLRHFRGWTDEEWAAAEDRLRQRGWLDDDGGLTTQGQQLLGAVERHTDSISAEPWERMDEATRERFFSLLAPLAARLEAPDGLIFPNPIGVPRPGPASV